MIKLNLEDTRSTGIFCNSHGEEVLSASVSPIWSQISSKGSHDSFQYLLGLQSPGTDGEHAEIHPHPNSDSGILGILICSKNLTITLPRKKLQQEAVKGLPPGKGACTIHGEVLSCHIPGCPKLQGHFEFKVSGTTERYNTVVSITHSMTVDPHLVVLI